MSTASSYSSDPGLVRALPKTLTALGSSASRPKPSTNSAWMRMTRHGSAWSHSTDPWLSRSRWSVVVWGMALPRSVAGPCRRERGSDSDVMASP